MFLIKRIENLDIVKEDLRQFMEKNPYETIVDLEDPEFQNLKIAWFYVEYLEQGEENALLFEIDELKANHVLENDFYKMNPFVMRKDFYWRRVTLQEKRYLMSYHTLGRGDLRYIMKEGDSE